MTAGFPFVNPTVGEVDQREEQRKAKRRTRPCRAMPEDFAQIAPGKTERKLTKHYRTGEKVVQRWAEQSGIVLARCRQGAPPPDNWKDLCATGPIMVLESQLNVSGRTIRRWIAETGIRPVPFVRKKAIVGLKSKPKQPKNLGQMGGGKLVIRHDNRTRSIWDDAAAVLRADRWTVFRCGPTGAYMAAGLHWRVGNVVVTPDELLMRADRVRARLAS